MLWFLTSENMTTKVSNVPDLYKRWELRLIDRFEFVAPPLSSAVTAVNRIAAQRSDDATAGRNGG